MIFGNIKIELNYKKLICGLILGLICFALLFNKGLAGLVSGIVMLLLFTAVALIRIDSDKRFISITLDILWALAMAVLTLFWSMMAIDYIAIWQLQPLHLALNIAIFFALALLLLCFTGRWKAAASLSGILLFILGAVNWLTWQFRGKELLFSDIHAAETALNVVGQYIPQVSFRAGLAISLWLLCFFCQFSYKHPRHTCRIFHRLAAITGAILLMLGIFVSSRQIPVKTWQKEGTVFNGFYLNFALSYRDSFITEPENYSPQRLKAIEDRYPATAANPGDDLPNIIVIMNESFADLRVFGDGLNTNMEVMPFYDSLEENCQKGYAYVSTFGGGTANSEFELLTGLNIGLLPYGSIPYTQFINGQLYSLPRILSDYGYESLASHPYLSSGWSRTKVYPLLGFDSYSFIEDYPQKELVREYISDREMYEYILDRLESNGDKKQFIFGISMQNHGGYTYEGDNFKNSVELMGYDNEYPMAEQYLSLINSSDKALEYLIGELEACPENTVLLFFGDHLPNIEKELFEQIHGSPLNGPDEQMLQYKVPFMLWANYDIPELSVDCSSLSYLGRYVLDAAGIALPPYYQFLAELEKEIPAISSMGYYSHTEGSFIPTDKAEGNEALWLEEFSMLQYNSLFDQKSKSSIFSFD